MVAVSGSVGVARTSATVVEKVDCVQQFLRWSMGSPNTYTGAAPASVGSTFFSGITNECRTENLTKSMEYSDCKLNNFSIRVLSEFKLTESASHLPIWLQLCQGWCHAA
jgi:hypothetical protein